MHAGWFAVGYLVGLIPVRIYAGGYHARTHIECNIVFELIFAGSVVISNFLQYSYSTVIGAWDYKQYLGQYTTYYDPELQATMTGETIGNFHYGYVGSVCFTPFQLKTAAGLAQIWAGTSNSSYWNSYFDDPNDQVDIQWGINVYNQEH